MKIDPGQSMQTFIALYSTVATRPKASNPISCATLPSENGRRNNVLLMQVISITKGTSFTPPSLRPKIIDNRNRGPSARTKTHWSSGMGEDKSALAQICKHSPFYLWRLITQHIFEERMDIISQ